MSTAKRETPYSCQHLVVVNCTSEDCPKPNNHFFCRGCNLNVNLPESHTYTKQVDST